MLYPVAVAKIWFAAGEHVLGGPCAHGDQHIRLRYILTRATVLEKGGEGALSMDLFGSICPAPRPLAPVKLVFTARKHEFRAHSCLPACLSVCWCLCVAPGQESTASA